MIPERADAESVILQKAHVIPEKREIQVDPGMNKFRDPVKDEDHRVVFVGLTNRRLEKPGIVPADGVRGKIHGIVLRGTERGISDRPCAEEMIPLQHRHGIFGERSAGIRERDRRGDPVFREEVIQAGQFLLDLRLGKLPQIRMVPGMIGDFESGGVELADLPAGHEETFVLRATGPTETKKTARFLLPPSGFRYHRSGKS